MVDHYLSKIVPQVVTEGIAKVSLTFTDELEEPPVYSQGRSMYPWPFDFAAYNSATLNQFKQQLVLESLHNALVWMAEREGWAIEPLNAACQDILDCHFKFTGYSKKSWLCPRKLYRARIYFDWQLEGVELSAILYRNRSSAELARTPLGTAIPMGGILYQYLNAGKWQTESLFTVAASSPFRKEMLVDFATQMAENTD